MNEMTTTNLNRLAAEVNSIKQYTGRIVLSACIEVGRRLKEAKNLVEYGEWGTWVENNVDYSQRRANDMIKLYEEYGSEQTTLLESEDSQTIAKLDYTKALALLSLPEEERNEFLENNDVENMSTKKFKEEIKELTKNKNAAEIKFSKEQALRKTTEMNLRRAENNVLELKATIADMEETTSEDVKQKLEDAQTALQKEKDEVKKLKEKLAEKPTVEIKEVVPDDIKRKLEELKSKVSSDESPLMIKYKLKLSELKKDIDEIMGTLDEVNRADDAEGNRCKGALAKLLGRTLEGLG